jgi:hypothetical protein
MESVLQRSFQPSLAKRARLTSLIFLMPRPPRSLGRQMESQAFRVSFLELLGGKPHQNFLKLLSREEHRLIGIRKELIP